MENSANGIDWFERVESDLASAAFLIWHLNVIQSLVNMIGGSDNEKENFYRMCNSIGNTAG